MFGGMCLGIWKMYDSLIPSTHTFPSPTTHTSPSHPHLPLSPTPFLPIRFTVPCYRTLYNYTPLNNDDLPLKKGDIVILIEAPYGGEWWKGTAGEHSGWFPKNYVEYYDEEEEKKKAQEGKCRGGGGGRFRGGEGVGG